MAKMIQPSMAGGEVSASVGARVDLSKRAVAVERAENFVATFTGAMASRPGQKFVAQTKGTAGAHRIIEFEFNTEQTFVLELGEQYIRFHTLGSQILDSSAVKSITNATQADPVVVTSSSHGLSDGDEVYIAGVGGMEELNGRNFLVANAATNTFELQTLQGDPVDGTGYSAYTSGGTATPPYELAAPWAADDLFDISYAQSGDVTTLVHPDYAPRELVRVANDNWTLSEIDFLPEVGAPSGISATANTTGTLQRNYTVTAVSEDDSEEGLRGTSGDDISISDITQADPVVVTTSSAHDLQELDEVEISGVGGMTQLNGERFQVRIIDSTSFSLDRLDGTPVDSTSFTAYTSGGSAYPLFVKVTDSADANWDNTITWNPVSGAQYYKVYASTTFGTFGFVGSTPKTSFQDANLGPDYTVTPPLLYTPFDDFVDGTGKYPGATGFFGQRRWFASSDNNPNRFWATQIAHFNNFSRSVPPLSSDSIVASIAARRINDIKHIVPLTDIVMLTSGGEYRLTGGESGVITPSTINVRPQSYYGTTILRPIVAGDVALFMSPGEFVRDLGYQIESDKFVGRDITVLARHLFDGTTFVDWDYAPSPNATAFLVRGDGMGVFLTYQPDQDVYAWTRATTRGRYKSTCVVREGDYDITYVLVERVVGGSKVKFLERMDARQFNDLQDAFFVDAGLTLDNPITITGATATDPVVVTAPGHGLSNGDTVDVSDILEADTTANEGEALSGDYNGTGFTVANVTTDTFELQNEGSDYDGSAFAAYSSGGEVRKAVTTVSGLWHLEGETVVAAANGYAEKDLTVTNGQVTLGAPASRIHVGLGYYCRLATLPLSTYADGQTTQGRAKNVNRLTVQVENTMGMWYGPTVDQMREAKFGLPSRYGQPLQMRTEDIDVTMKPDWGKRKQVVIEQRDPLPMTVLTLIPDATLGGN